jgi:hypothetical protein
VLQELFKGTNRVRVQFAWRQDASGRLVAVPYVVGRARNRTVPTARRTGPTRIGAILIERQRLARALERATQPTPGQPAGGVADRPRGVLSAPTETDRPRLKSVRLCDPAEPLSADRLMSPHVVAPAG